MAAQFARLSRVFRCQSRYYSAPLDSSIPPAKEKYVPKSGTYPKGFLVSGTHAGVKPTNTKFPDIALVTSEEPCAGAAVFTTNKFQAAPVTVSRDMLQKRNGQGVRGIVVNSGCANAVTGKGGVEDAISMGQKLDQCFKDGGAADDGKGGSAIVMSTGVIGQRYDPILLYFGQLEAYSWTSLPIQRILNKIPVGYANLSSTHKDWLTAARAICTTDTFPKLVSSTFQLPSSPNVTYSIAGMSKGAGMIHPNMATLLGIVCTDAPIAPSPLQSLLTHAVDRSFNSISIDGDTSTNDTVALLANGAAGGKPILDQHSPDYAAMEGVLTSFTQQLSQLVVRDGEGATKFVTVKVQNSSTYADAKLIASTIARSPLVKTALYGKDANWGRILCAVGYTQGLKSGTVIPDKTSVSFVPVDGSEELKLLVNGEPESVDEDRAAIILESEDLEIKVDLGGGENGTGKEEANYWFCDFSHEYVTINGDYRT